MPAQSDRSDTPDHLPCSRPQYPWQPTVVRRILLSAVLLEPARFSCVVFLFPLRDAPFPLSSHDSTCAQWRCATNTFRGLVGWTFLSAIRSVLPGRTPVRRTFLSAVLAYL